MRPALTAAMLGGMNTITFTSPLALTLRAHGFAGRVVEPAHPDYDEARSCWNGDVDRRPAAVAYAEDVDDVAAAVRAARDSGVGFAVRCGGHSVAGRSVPEGGLCIDLRRLSSVHVDPERRIARVGGGTLLAELDVATQKHGLAVPAGQISHTGVGGLTLGGGLGWLVRRHGLTIDSLLAVEVVLADGQIVRASHDEHPDLFWALRGGGADFGVVTRFEFRAHPVGPIVHAGAMIYPWEQARDVFHAADTLMATAPDELTIYAVLLTAPPEDPFPAELRGRPAVVVAVAWSGEPAAGEHALAPLRASCPALVDLVGPMSYVALQSMLDETAPHGWRYYDRMHYLREVGDGFVDALVGGFESVPTPQSHVMTSWMGGAADRVAPGETAFGHRGARAFTWLIGCSAETALGPTADWVRHVWDATALFSTGGVYVNALNAERPVRDAYAEEVWARLVAVKRRYDPDGVLVGTGIR